MGDVDPDRGATNLDRLEENISSIDIELTAGDQSAIDRACSSIVVQGARYPELHEG